VRSSKLANVFIVAAAAAAAARHMLTTVAFDAQSLIVTELTRL